VPIAADVTATTEPVTVSNFPATQAVSIATLPALATGTNTVGNVNILDADVVATGTITVTDTVVAAPAGSGVFVSGTSTAGSYVFITLPGGDSAWNLQITGLTTGTLYFEGSLDSTNGIDGQWIAVNGRQTGVINTNLGLSTTVNGMYRGNTSGLKYFRTRSVGALTGTPAIVIRASGGTGSIFLNASIPTGTNSIGTVQPPAITKGTQSTSGITTQDLKDAGRNQVHYYTLIPVAGSATDTLQTLTGTKAGATVVASVTPAVVTAGKTFRITRINATFIATAVSGYAVVRLRFNTAGVVAVTSPVAASLAVGSSAPVTANATGTQDATLSEGWEFAAATGVGISVQTFAGVTATGAGFVMVSLTGYEY
jgi:hypothetical protein